MAGYQSRMCRVEITNEGGGEIKSFYIFAILRRRWMHPVWSSLVYLLLIGLSYISTL